MKPAGASTIAAVREALLREGATPDESALGDFLAQAGPAYLSRERPESIAQHFRFAAELGPARRACVAVSPREDGSYDVSIVAIDYFGELSLLCGLLAAHGLDVESGHVHTLEAGPASPPARVVDVFRVRARDGTPPDARRLESELLDLLELASSGRGPEARERVSLWLTDVLSAPASSRTPSATPVTIRFDDPPDPTWTAMEVRGPDARGFLYAVANALALRGIYIHGVEIESVGREARDRFLLAGTEGGRLSGHDLAALGQAVALVRQFTYFLPWAPDPVRALRYFDQLLDRLPSLGPHELHRLASPEALFDLARLLGSSAFLWEDVVRPSFGRLLPLLAGCSTRQPRSRQDIEARLTAELPRGSGADLAGRLRAVRDEEALLIETRRLLDERFTLEAFAAALTDLGEALVAGASRAAYASLTETHGRPLGTTGHECPLAILALGKFGGRELGHASDLELLFVYEDAERTERTGYEGGRFFDDLVRETMTLLQAPGQALFRPDLRLRPHGNKGPLASPLRALRDYYRPEGGAAAFERQASIKLRFVAGDPALGARVEALRDSFVWSGEPWDREGSLRLRERQTRELVPPGRFNVKLSRGGLVDAEYAVQYLQLQSGHSRPELRTPSTLVAMGRLAAAGLLDATEHNHLREGYLFWRNVVDGLRVVRGQSDDLLLPPESSDDFAVLARRLGYSGGRRVAALAFADDVARHRHRLVTLFDRRFL